MFDSTTDLAADIKRHTSDLRSQLAKLDGYADALAEVAPSDEYAAARYAPDRLGDMLGTLGRSTASATSNLLRSAARTAVSATEKGR